MTDVQTERPPVPRAVVISSTGTVSRWWALPVLMAGTFLIVLDFFIVNVALPTIGSDLHAGAAGIEWVIAGYGLAFAVCLVAAGRIADRFGRRRIFSAGMAVFALASLGCAAAPTTGVLVATRVVQGMAAAAISATVLAIIGVVFTGPARAQAISVYGVVMGVAAAGGQLIGGVLTDADVAGLSWRFIFLINVPVAMAALAVVTRLVPESRAEQACRVDVLGALLLTIGLTGLVLPLTSGREHNWPMWTWLSMLAGAVVLACFAAWQRVLGRSHRTPLLDPVLFRTRAFRLGLTIQLTYWCSQASFYLVLALYLQQGRGLDPTQAGLVFTILAAAYLATSLRAPALTARHGRSVITFGAVLLAVGFAALLGVVAAIGTAGSVAALAAPLLLIGAGKGLCVTPLTMTVLAHAEPSTAGVVSGALSTMQQAGNTLGVAITGVIFFGTLGAGYGHALTLSLAELCALLLVVAALTRQLPRPKSTTA